MGGTSIGRRSNQVSIAICVPIGGVVSDFRVDFVSDATSEFLLVEISYKAQRLCQINKEKGVDDLEIEFLSDVYLRSEELRMVFPLKEFQHVLHEAAKGLAAT